MEKKEFNMLSLRAAIDESTINVEDRSFDVVIATETPITYRDYRYKDSYDGNAELYDEVLMCDENAVEVARLDAGIPLFPSHLERGALNQLGITTQYILGDRACKATIKLGARADEALWVDIQNKVTKAVSIGVKIYESMRSTVNGKLTYTATKWSPMHVALAPEPADVNCTVLRSSDMVIREEKQEQPKKSFINSLTQKFPTK